MTREQEILAELDAAIAGMRASFAPELLGGYEDVIALRVARVVADHVMYSPDVELSESLREAVLERIARDAS